MDRRAHRVRARRIDGDAHRNATRAQRRGKQRRADRTIGLGRRHIVPRHEEAGDEADADGAGQGLRGGRQFALGCVDQGLGAPTDVAAD